MEFRSEVLILDERSNLWVMRLGDNENVPLHWISVGTFVRGDTRYSLFANHEVDLLTARAIVRAYHDGLLKQSRPDTYSWEV